MIKTASLLSLVLATAACAAPPADDLGTFVGGEADVAAIRTPIRIDSGETVELALAASAAFEIVTAYMPDGELELVATDDAGAAVTALGRQPRLVVDVPRMAYRPGEEPGYTIAVTNRSAAEIRGTLSIGPAAQGCLDEVWLPWFETLVRKLGNAAVDGYLDAAEKTAVDAIIAGAPCAATTDTAYLAWHARFDTRISVANADGYISDADTAFITPLAAVRPVATGDSAYNAWLDKFAPRLTLAEVDGYQDPAETSVLDLVVTARPVHTGDPAYVRWSGLLETRLRRANVDGFMTDAERTFMMTLVEGKACGTGTAAQAAWNALAAAAPNNAADLLAAARPGAGCAP